MNFSNWQYPDLTMGLRPGFPALKSVSVLSDCAISTAMEHGSLQGRSQALELRVLEVC